MNDPLDSAIPVGSGPGNPVPPPPTPPPASPPPASVAPPPDRPPTGSDKIWAMLSHLSFFFGILIVIMPLVVYLAMRRESEYAASNAKEALNFHLSYLIYTLCALPLIWLLIGIPLMAVLTVGALVLTVIAAVKASDGGVYRYPLTIRLVK
jgi:uncharacterized Tic20 family protein